MFQRTILQFTCCFTNNEIRQYQDNFSVMLAETIDREIGGTCYQNVYVRKGTKYIDILSFSMPESDGELKKSVVHFKTDTFFPVCTPGTLYELKVIKQCTSPEFHHSQSPHGYLECVLHDPEAEEVVVMLKAIVLVKEEEKEWLDKIITVQLQQFDFHYRSTYFTCSGVTASN